MKKPLIWGSSVLFIIGLIIISGVGLIANGATTPEVSDVSLKTLSVIEGTGVYGLTIGSHPVSWPFSGFNTDLYDRNKKWQGRVKQVSISICNPTTSGADENCLLVARSAQTTTTTGSGSYNFLVRENLPARLADETDSLRQYYDGLYTKIKICPILSSGPAPLYQIPVDVNASCAYSPLLKVVGSKTETVEPGTKVVEPETKATLAPTISSVNVSNLASAGTYTGTSQFVYNWPVGEAHNLLWSFANFGGTTNPVKTVSISICNPATGGTSGVAEKCLVVPMGGGVVLNKVSSYYTASNGRISYELKLGAKMYSVLTPQPPVNPDYDSDLAQYYDNYQYRLKVCPSYGDGSVVPGATCAYSQYLRVAIPLLKISSVSIISQLGTPYLDDDKKIVSGWPTGEDYSVGWTFSGLGSSVVDKEGQARVINQVAISGCNPATSGINEKCNLWLTSSPNETSHLLETGPKWYKRSSPVLDAKDPEVGNLGQFFDNQRFRLKICPVFSDGSQAGQVPTGATCAYSLLLKVVEPYNTDLSLIPAGSVCLRRSCVCYGGLKVLCSENMAGETKDNPSCSSLSCGTPTKTSSSLSQRLLGAVLSPFNGLLKLLHIGR